MKSAAKQIVYRYDGDATTDEVITDLDGEINSPQKDQVLTQKGQRWKVVHVTTEVSNVPGQIPVVRVFLSKQG